MWRPRCRQSPTPAFPPRRSWRRAICPPSPSNRCASLDLSQESANLLNCDHLVTMMVLAWLTLPKYDPGTGVMALGPQSGVSELPIEGRHGCLVGLSLPQPHGTVVDGMHGLQVEEHDDRESSWFVYENKVYDATKFLADHPGGPESILIVAGQVLSCCNLCAPSVNFVICQLQVCMVLLQRMLCIPQ